MQFDRQPSGLRLCSLIADCPTLLSDVMMLVPPPVNRWHTLPTSFMSTLIEMALLAGNDVTVTPAPPKMSIRGPEIPLIVDRTWSQPTDPSSRVEPIGATCLGNKATSPQLPTLPTPGAAANWISFLKSFCVMMTLNPAIITTWPCK